MFKKFLCLKTKQNTEMSDEEHSDSEFYYPEEQVTAERKVSRHGWHFDKVEASGDTSVRNKNKLLHLVLRKKRDIHEENSCKFGKYFNMNCSEFASVLYRTFSKVIPSRSNDTEKVFKVALKLLVDLFIYVIYLYPVEPEQDVFEQIEFGLQADHQ